MSPINGGIVNLIERKMKPSIINQFRLYQYSLLQDIISQQINYLIDEFGLQHDKYFDKTKPIVIEEDASYIRINHYATYSITSKLFRESSSNFLNINIPKLVDGSFFVLNSGWYIPLCYIGETISYKKNSVMLYSAIHPITMNLHGSDNRVIFMGNNISLRDFLLLISRDWPKEAIKAIDDEFGLTPEKYLPDIIKHCSKIFKIKSNDHSEIINHLSKLFFDPWTSELYRTVYNIYPNISQLILNTFSQRYQLLHDDTIDRDKLFIDLRIKRLMFIEPILRPIFRAVSKCISELLSGKQPMHLKLASDEIIKRFYKDLNGNSLYNTTNGFSSILAHKASFKNPSSDSKLPRAVSSIHFTHKGRICSNSISNQSPGETVSLISDQNIDLKFGTFIENCKIGD